MRVRAYAPGPSGHGVVRHAALVADAVREHGFHPTHSDADLTHAQFSDSLYGAGIAQATRSFLDWAATAPRPLVVTLHDVPGGDPDARRDRERISGYREVAGVCDAILVSSRHEAVKARAFTDRQVHVIDLPLPSLPAPGPRPWWADQPVLGVLGFLYPGKGHARAIDAAARSPLHPRVVAAGSTSPGHADLERSLAKRAADLGVDLVVTGTLSDADMAAAAAAITVPLVLHDRASASGTLLTWWGSRRRPLAAPGDYAVELHRRHPGSLALCADDSALDRAVAAALDSVGSTWLSSTPPWPDVGAAHVRLYHALCGVAA
ncbi:hypothetical protein V5P93_003826 [Actinokineospora auranticolor]|uniref:Glycosyltransferase involved in cell wall biosynthesis n=1 Tax=Actinokineospora auranticolor TaxID=155976 RepID=A0A2S6GLK2_9PSEU|nr:glycosyltransferase family 4 protein [Actinokineospora auranticolor]PPK66114.1 glycosyltransferase involved in cell wall biosynthesis [Actinokineospora auranticolor]